MENIFSIKNKKILVTGASSGIGRQIGITCSALGGEMILTARNEKRLSETSTQLTGLNNQTIVADLNIDDQINTLADQCPALDGVVLNAGLVKIMPLKYFKPKSIEELFFVNIQSSMLLINRLIKTRKLNPKASICFISSIASMKSTPGNAVYSATKGAVNSFSRAIALELAGKQIRSNAILPGFIDTDILSKDIVNKENLETHKKNYPLGRFGKPSDVANLAVYLLSDASNWMTGSLLTLDGGYSLK